MKESNARLVLAFDVAGSSGSARLAVRNLRSILAKHRQPATWSFSDLSSPAVAELLADDADHEVGLLAASQWSGPNATRHAFYQGMHSQLQQATLAGVSIASIATEHAEVPEHLDLLGKFGVGAVRTARTERRGWSVSPKSSKAVATPTALRYGVWQMPTTVDVARDGARLARTALRKAVSRGETVVLGINAEHVASSIVERLVQTAASATTQGRLQIQTLTAAADSLARRRRMTPAQSILRVA